MEYYYYDLGLGKEVSARQYIHEINIYRFNWHPEIEIIWMMNGRADVCVEGQNYEMEPDDILIIHSNQGHASMLRQLDSMAMVLHINPVVFADTYEDYKNIIFHGFSSTSTRYEPGFITIRTCLARMMLLSRGRTASSDMASRGHFYQLLSCLIENFSIKKGTDFDDHKNLKDQRQIHTIMKYTEKYYYRKIKLDEIADLSGYNHTYISTFFRQHMGINYYEYLSRVRLRKAVHQLNTTGKNLTQVALDNGFPNTKSFSSYFKKYFQMVPKEYKALVKQRSGPIFNELERIYISCPNPVIEAKLYECAGSSQKKAVTPDHPSFERKEYLRSLCEEMLNILNNE